MTLLSTHTFCLRRYKSGVCGVGGCVVGEVGVGVCGLGVGVGGGVMQCGGGDDSVWCGWRCWWVQGWVCSVNGGGAVRFKCGVWIWAGGFGCGGRGGNVWCVWGGAGVAMCGVGVGVGVTMCGVGGGG